MDSVFWIIEGSLCGRPGPAEAPWDIEELKEAGVGSIVSLDQDNVDHLAIVAAGIDHRSFELPDSIPPTEEDAKLWQNVLPEALNHIREYLSKHETVMVHCHAGKDRTGILLGSYLTLVKGFDAGCALKKLRDVRPVALSSEGYEAFFHQLMEEMKNR